MIGVTSFDSDESFIPDRRFNGFQRIVPFIDWIKAEMAGGGQDFDRIEYMRTLRCHGGDYKCKVKSVAAQALPQAGGTYCQGAPEGR